MSPSEVLEKVNDPQIKNALHQARKQVLGRGISLDSGIVGGKRCIR
jgi:hypothetical protein